jgi:glutaredoxin
VSLIFRFLRWFLGGLIRTGDRLFPPARPARDAQAQARIDARTRGLAIYQFESCPFCVKVRRALARMGLQVELRDVRAPTPEGQGWKDELVREGGRYQVPCLRIPEPEGRARWLYESDDIIAYLQGLLA